MMTKKKQIDVLTRTIGDYRKENRQLKKANRLLAEEAAESRKNAIFWQEQALRLMKNHPTVQEISVMFKATADLPKKQQRLFTMD